MKPLTDVPVNRVETSCSPKPLMTRTGRSNAVRRNSRRVSIPSIRGMVRSSSTAPISFRCSAKTSSPARPSGASRTANPAFCSARRATIRRLGSSSIIRTVLVPVVRVILAVATSSGCGSSEQDGRRTVKRVPVPRVLATRMVPRWPRMISSTPAKPSPRPVNFVVKNGSKIRFNVSSLMPQPVSSTSILA